MKNIQLKFVLVACLVLITSVKSFAQISKAEIIATGLTCSMCSNAINKQLKALPEVLKVETDLNTNTFVVTLSDKNALTPKTFKDKVEKAGFFIGSLVLTVNADATNKSPYIIVNGNENKSDGMQIQVLDKGYVTEKEFKKLSKSYKNIETYAVNNEEDFHIKFVK